MDSGCMKQVDGWKACVVIDGCMRWMDKMGRWMEPIGGMMVVVHKVRCKLNTRGCIYGW